MRRGWGGNIFFDFIILPASCLTVLAGLCCPADDDELLTTPDAAWAGVEKAQQAAFARPEWREREPSREEVAAFQKQIQAANRTLANSAIDFIARFPTNENVGDARCAATLGLVRAVAAGDSGGEQRLHQFVTSVLADEKIQEDDRVAVLCIGDDLPLMKKLGLKVFIEGRSKFPEEFDKVYKDALFKAFQRFPNSGRVYVGLLSLADRAPSPEEKRRLATAVLEAHGASAAFKECARHVLNGSTPYEIGKPLDIRFKALDGREVDLAALKGKVVLVDFWATDCGPCVGEVPNIKAAYEQFHDRGFEIIGISLDDKESALRKFIREKKLAWPQHFDGRGWENKFALRYGIRGIPEMWLVDRGGNLRVTNARGNLADRVEALLQE